MRRFTKKHFQKTILILSAVISCTFVFAQSGSQSGARAGSQSGSQSGDLPKGYGGIELGMNVDETKKALKANGDFGYNGDRDVSLLPGENRILIETDARDFARWSFLEQCWFQFYKDKLYVIILNLNKKKVDYYSVFSSLCKKYGDPVEFSPERAVWKNDDVQFSLERPLVLKYIDLKTFNSLIDESLVENSEKEKLRDEFLDSL
ncbi:hypothetical protein [Treponema sp.]|uniref:hypothetical protein n=1 Tax=Treponema sp. TaxID=166 RepID=UPI00298E2C8E|nr:hypothetical protein [Treponema sp.]MCR5612589.1 hypothetical protein [Treponema sp.]